MPVEAATDFFFLQNRGYPRARALDWVGDRYRLTRLERDILHRGVFGQETALRRRAKECLGGSWRGGRLVVDGHNVHITMESFLLGRPLILANDGALRDLAGVSSGFRLSETSLAVVDTIFRFLERFPPREALFLFDAPMSHSGRLANTYRERLHALGIPGDARAVPVPEREIPYGECTVAGSDGAVLDASMQWIDLVRWVLDEAGRLQFLADFSRLILARGDDVRGVTGIHGAWKPVGISPKE